jgi:hypothetical protein
LLLKLTRSSVRRRLGLPGAEAYLIAGAHQRLEDGVQMPLDVVRTVACDLGPVFSGDVAGNNP